MSLSDLKEAKINLAYSQLKTAGLQAESSNQGIHIKVRTAEGVADLWPTTDKWCVAPAGQKRQYGMGLAGFLARISHWK